MDNSIVEVIKTYQFGSLEGLGVNDLVSTFQKKICIKCKIRTGDYYTQYKLIVPVRTHTQKCEQTF